MSYSSCRDLGSTPGCGARLGERERGRESDGESESVSAITAAKPETCSASGATREATGAVLRRGAKGSWRKIGITRERAMSCERKRSRLVTSSPTGSAISGRAIVAANVSLPIRTVRLRCARLRRSAGFVAALVRAWKENGLPMPAIAFSNGTSPLTTRYLVAYGERHFRSGHRSGKRKFADSDGETSLCSTGALRRVRSRARKSVEGERFANACGRFLEWHVVSHDSLPRRLRGGRFLARLSTESVGAGSDSQASPRTFAPWRWRSVHFRRIR